MMVPVAVSFLLVSVSDSPKSRIFTSGGVDDVRKMLSGLRSRCTTPRACVSLSAAQAAVMMGQSSAGSMGPSRDTFSRSVTPSRYSMASQSVPSGAAPNPWMPTMPGWSMEARISASRRKRSSDSPDDLVFFRTFSATRCPVCMSCAS
jgi:hypothetical protein